MVAIARVSEVLWTAHASGALSAWKGSERVCLLQLGSGAPVCCMALVSRGLLWCGRNDGRVVVVYPAKQQVLAEWSAHNSLLRYVGVVEQKPRAMFCTASQYGSVRLWDVPCADIITAFNKKLS